VRALLLTGGGLISAKIIDAWIADGNSVAAIWIGSLSPRLFLARDRALGSFAPSWSISALAQRYRIPVQSNPKLSVWVEAANSIRQLNADLLITSLSYEIIPEAILRQFLGRAVNFHPAVLPHYRGPNPRSGMILDRTAELHGGVTLHCLSPEIDKGEVIGFRKVAYEPNRGFREWNVRQALAAGDLVHTELSSYLTAALSPRSPVADSGSYRKVDPSELVLSDRHSASRTKWLCDELGSSGWIRFRRSEGEKAFIIDRFIRKTGPRTFKPEKIGKFAIEFDAADARVRVGRRGDWRRLLKTLAYLVAVARTRNWAPKNMNTHR